MRVMEILSHATNSIAEGEVLQLLNTNDPDTDEGRYMEVIRARPPRCSRPAPGSAPCSRGARSPWRRPWPTTA